MNPDHAFQHAVLEEPDDDAVRLVYADWLEDRGDPRGELIRVQVRLAAWEPDLCRRTELRRREEELLARHSARWLGPLRRLCTRHEFHRGFARLTMPAALLLGRRSGAFTRKLFRQAAVEWLHLQGSTSAVAELARTDHLGELTALDLSGNQLGDDAVRALAESPHLKCLTRLDLSNNRLSDAAIGALLDADWCRRLTWIGLRNNRLTSKGASALAEACDPARLRWFDLHGNDLEPVSLARYARFRPARSGRLINSLGMEFALIPAGTFLMGSPETEATRKRDEGPQRPITISRPFYLGVYAVTQEQYQAVMGANPSQFTAETGGGPAHPVETVNWEEAVEFCRRLSQWPAEERNGRVYRLPTEAEWEYACRAGTTTAFHYGPALSSREANLHGGQPYFAPPGPHLERTTPVGSYAPNAFGLYDLHGNVWEWCQDWYSDTYLADVAAVDPVGPTDGTHRVQRGGCWNAYGECCRAAYRSSNDPPTRQMNCVGFRVALTVNEPGPK